MAELRTHSECFFLDVGQGTSQVLYLSDGRAIVIDGGPQSNVTSDLLFDLRVHTIERLIATHHDADHIQGLRVILEEHQEKIREVWFLVDREPLADIRLIQHLEDINRQRLRDRRSEIPYVRLEMERSPVPRTVFADPARSLELQLVYPDLRANLAAIRSRRSNAASAVLRLYCGARPLIVFPGDATLRAWRRIHQHFGCLECDILAIPHHGGVIWERQSGNRLDVVLRWLYTAAVKCRYAIFSVGTTNPFGHPRPEVVQIVREASAKRDEPPTILCTELTGHCCLDPNYHLPGIIAPHPISRSGREDGHVACAGTIVVELATDGVTLPRIGEHQAGVEALAQSGGSPRPLCRN